MAANQNAARDDSQTRSQVFANPSDSAATVRGVADPTTGAQYVYRRDIAPGEDGNIDRQKTIELYQSAYFRGSATFSANQPVYLHRITVTRKAVGGTITLYAASTATGTPTVIETDQVGTYEFDDTWPALFIQSAGTNLEANAAFTYA